MCSAFALFPFRHFELLSCLFFFFQSYYGLCGLVFVLAISIRASFFLLFFFFLLWS